MKLLGIEDGMAHPKQTRTDAFFLPPTAANFAPAGGFAPLDNEGNGYENNSRYGKKTEIGSSQGKHRYNTQGNSYRNNRGVTGKGKGDQTAEQLITKFNEVRNSSPLSSSSSAFKPGSSRTLQMKSANRLTLVNSPSLLPRDKGENAHRPPKISTRVAPGQSSQNSPHSLTPQRIERTYSIVGNAKALDSVAPLIALAEQCTEVRTDFESLKNTIANECRAAGEFFDSAIANIASNLDSYNYKREMETVKLTKIERANALLMRELIQTKETLADAHAERDILMDELQLCENLGGAPIEALKARGQELAAMRARAVLANVRSREMSKASANENAKAKLDREEGKVNGEAVKNRRSKGTSGADSSEARDDKSEGKPSDDGAFKATDLFYRCLNSALLSIQLEDVEFTKMLSLLKTSEGRDAFVWAMKSHKAPPPEASKCISETAFEMFAYLTKECLDNCCKEVPIRDYGTAKAVLSMEVAFCTPGKAGTTDFIFLQSRISRHEIWTDAGFWEEAFFAALEIARGRMKVNVSEFPNLTPKEQKNFIKTEQGLVLELLNSFHIRMSMSNVEKLEREGLLARLCQIHDISPERMKHGIAQSQQKHSLPPKTGAGVEEKIADGGEVGNA